MDDEARRLAVLREMYNKAKLDLDLGERTVREGRKMCVPSMVEQGATMVELARKEIGRVIEAIGPQPGPTINHRIELTVGDDDLRRLVELAETTLPAVQFYHQWLARIGDVIGKNGGRLDAPFSSICGLAERLRLLSDGTYPAVPLLRPTVFYQVTVNGRGDGDLFSAVAGLASWLLSFEATAHAVGGNYPAIDDESLRNFTNAVESLRALCDTAKTAGPAEALSAGKPLPEEPEGLQAIVEEADRFIENCAPLVSAIDEARRCCVEDAKDPDGRIGRIPRLEGLINRVHQEEAASVKALPATDLLALHMSVEILKLAMGSSAANRRRGEARRLAIQTGFASAFIFDQAILMGPWRHPYEVFLPEIRRIRSEALVALEEIKRTTARRNALPKPETLADGRIVPLILGDTHEYEAKVWVRDRWVTAQLNQVEYKVMRAVLNALRSGKGGLNIDSLKIESGVSSARDIFNKLKRREPFKFILPPPSAKGRGSGINYRIVCPCIKDA